MMVGVSALVGMFSPQAVEKLKKISEAILTTAPPAPDKAPPAPGALSIRDVDPKQVASAGGQRVTILGTGFGDKTTVLIGGAAAANLQVVSSAQLSVDAPARAPGKANVEVRDSNGNSATLAQSIEYV